MPPITSRAAPIAGCVAAAGANDLVAQASTGIMSLNTGADGRPMKIANSGKVIKELFA